MLTQDNLLLYYLKNTDFFIFKMKWSIYHFYSFFPTSILNRKLIQHHTITDRTWKMSKRTTSHRFIHMPIYTLPINCNHTYFRCVQNQEKMLQKNAQANSVSARDWCDLSTDMLRHIHAYSSLREPLLIHINVYIRKTCRHWHSHHDEHHIREAPFCCCAPSARACKNYAHSTVCAALGAPNACFLLCGSAGISHTARVHAQ